VQLSKSYRLLRFLNRSHAIPTRAFFAVGAWILVWISTFRPVLGGRVAGVLWADDFKSGMRLAHWFVRRSWIGLDVADDPYFDFASWLAAEDLDEVEAFLNTRIRKSDPFEDATDRLYIIAARAHEALERRDLGAFRTFAARFEIVAARAAELERRNPLSKRKGKPSVFSSEDAGAALQDFGRLATSIGLEWYVISGTFLGIVREGGWLAHDYDIDLGVHAEKLDIDAVRTAIAASPSMILRKEDWQTRIIERDGVPELERLAVLFKIVHRTGINVDLFIHHLEDGVRWHGSSIHRWDNADFALTAYELAGMTVMGPAEHDRYLTENYGDWRTPVTDFNSTTGTPNMVPVANYGSRALFVKRGIELRTAAPHFTLSDLGSDS